MKKGEIYTGVVEKMDFPNKGVLHIGEEKVVVKNALPGQTVEIAISKQRKGKCEGRLLKVVTPADYEKAEGACPHRADCGGCTYQTVPYEEQLKIKERQVRALLDPVLPEGYNFEGIKGSPLTRAYRNKMEFSFGDEFKDGPMTLGMHKRGSFYDIVTVDQCVLVHTDCCKILKATLDYFTEQGATFYKKMAHVGYLRHLLVRRGVKTGEILVDLVTSTQTEGTWKSEANEEELLEGWKEELLALDLEGTFAGILHTENDSLADVVQSDRTVILYGQDFFMEELLGLKFKITPFSFFQTNSLGAEVLYETAREYIGDTKGRKVFDLYSGTGTIAQILAPAAEHVTGVEIVEEAVEAAKINAQRNGLTNCDFIAGDVLKVLDTLEERPDLIVLDPPRDGIHPKALPKIIKYGVDHMVYISCKPTSLARDLVVLQAGGYTAKRICCVDMFPATTGIETVVLLSKSEVDSKKIRVEFSLEDMDMSEFQDGATYTQIKDYVLEHSGLKVSNLYISQIKRKCGIEVGKNYNLPKSEDSRQPMCPPEKEKAIREAFKYFGMI
ncbi:23S rRNA (uracil-C(5))-methyltransferase RlmCD [uncultured Clostridium sp.]|nr:23S rRNA (uracil-C(5))-methyltransferase RlmCD [uncultured Clostridium sp.]